jgi:FkbM family methyltransferase
MRLTLSKISTQILLWISRIKIISSSVKVKYLKEDEGTINKLTLRELLGPNPVIIDVGAYDGSDAIEFSSIFPNGLIYAFEALPENFLKLWQNCQALDNIITICGAVGKTSGVKNFFQSSGTSDGSGSILPPSQHLSRHPGVLFLQKDELVVLETTLDTYLSTKIVSKVDLIWLDAQGAEQIVLEGGSSLIKKTSYVYMEVSEIPLYEGATSYTDIKTFMSNSGFKVFKEFLPKNWDGEGNVLFKNKMYS